MVLVLTGEHQYVSQLNISHRISWSHKTRERMLQSLKLQLTQQRVKIKKLATHSSELKRRFIATITAWS